VRVAFTIPGRPRGKARHRTSFKLKRQFPDPRTVAAEREIATLYRLAARSAPLITGAVSLSIEAVFRVPASWPKKLRIAALAGEVEFTGKPDRDNIDKLVMDALNAVAWVDDCQVNRGPVVRRYGEPERVEVVVEAIETPQSLKTPSERAREKKVATGVVAAKRRKPRQKGRPAGSELLAIGRRIR
jgi:Holliday junction resolvase RusA-like endonuclease